MIDGQDSWRNDVVRQAEMAIRYTAGTQQAGRSLHLALHLRVLLVT